MASKSGGIDRATKGRKPRGERAHTYAAIDLGTNNCRMLIARANPTGFRVIDGFSRIVRLGEGVGASGALSEAAIVRTIAALEVCARKMDRRGVSRMRGVATEACRRAANCGVFLDRVAAATGITLDIISSGEEARLALAGCLPLLDGAARRVLVFDIGGGSTELVWARHRADGPPEVVASTSLPCGVVTLAEEWGGDRIPRQVYEAMVDRVRGLLAPFEAELRLDGAATTGDVQMLGTSGTVTTLAGVFLELPRYDRAKVDGLWMSFADVEAVSERLLGLDYAARAAIPTIGSERADLVVAGCAILDAIHRTWPADRLRVADRGLREGMLLEMIEADEVGAAATVTSRRVTAGG